MLLKGIISEDFVNYKKICMTIETPFCHGFKCGKELCQNSPLALSPNIEIPNEDIVYSYLKNNITEAMCFQGLEPFDSFDDVLDIIEMLRENHCADDVVIYTGFNENEIPAQLNKLKKYDNIIVKFGRYIPNQESHYDEVLGVQLVSDNQYAKRIS